MVALFGVRQMGCPAQGSGIEQHAEAAGIAPFVVAEDQRDKLRVVAEFVGLE